MQKLAYLAMSNSSTNIALQNKKIAYFFLYVHYHNTKGLPSSSIAGTASISFGNKRFRSLKPQLKFSALVNGKELFLVKAHCKK